MVLVGLKELSFMNENSKIEVAVSVFVSLKAKKFVWEEEELKYI